MEKFPKVLTISGDPFNKSNGTGITLSNLFDGWDKNCIAQIYLSDIAPSNDVCNKYYKLKPQVVFFDYYLRKVLSFFSKSESEIAISPAGVIQNSLQESFKSKIHLNLRAIADFSPLFLSEDMFIWIKEFNPDIIYCALGSARMINLTNEIAAKIRKPIVPHFMDDWPSTLYTQNELGGLARKMFNNKFNKILLKSNGGLCISEQMAEKYKIRYKLPFSPFVNCVNDSLFSAPVFIKNEEFILMYVGGLHLNRWQSILDISEAIEQLNLAGKKIVLKIHCPLRDINLFEKHFVNFPATKFEGSLSSDEVATTLKKASLLLHIESFEENYAEFTKFSLSTKIPQYMAAGKPIFGYGPFILASMQHIVKSNSGKVVSEKNQKKLIESIEELVTKSELLYQYALNGFSFAERFHSKSYNEKKLKKVLISYSKLD